MGYKGFFTLKMGLGLVLATMALIMTIRAHQALARWSSPRGIPDRPSRIVSLAPSVTETLFSLGLGADVVGVTQFCHYPPEVKTKAVVAGFSDVNLEAVLRLRPDLVVLPVDKVRNQEDLTRLGLTTLSLDTRSLPGLLEMIKTLGQTTGHQSEARLMVERIESSKKRAISLVQGHQRPTVLFSIMHSYQGLGYITEINAVGQDGFFSELLELAGGENVYRGGLSFPRLSREAILSLNPDIIIDVIPGVMDLEAVRRDWLSLTTVSAIKNNRLYFLEDESDTVPGPRIYRTLDRISAAIQGKTGTDDACNL